MQTHASQGAAVLDDGEFCVELNGNHDPAEAPDFLQRRCYVGVTTPGGYECIGSFERNSRGKWQASIDAPYDEATGSDCCRLGTFPNRLDAIVAL